jgi:hypothetical protein
MLKLETEWHYWVWPSWATAFSFGWDEVPRLLADPVGTGCLDLGELQSLEAGYLVNDPGPLEFFSGAFGNGVIAYQPVQGRAWIGACVFRKEADVSTALGMTTAADLANSVDFRKVGFLELRGDAGLRFWGEGRKKPREYPTSVTFEHVEAAGEDMYWLLDRQPGKSSLKGLDTLQQGAAAFGLAVEPVDEVCTEMMNEVRPWFTDLSRMAWFRVSGGRALAGWQLAMMYYCAMHLKMLAGKRMRSMHLVAQIEHHPRLRRQWGRK